MRRVIFAPQEEGYCASIADQNSPAIFFWMQGTFC